MERVAEDSATDLMHKGALRTQPGDDRFDGGVANIDVIITQDEKLGLLHISLSYYRNRRYTDNYVNARHVTGTAQIKVILKYLTNQKMNAETNLAC